MLGVFQNYLKDKMQTVKIRGTVSDASIIKIGISQGTVLVPVLFIIYINSLLSLPINGTSIAYADNTVLLSVERHGMLLKIS